jgi:hypothetical protein
VNISTLIIKEDNSQINDLDNIFYQKPIDLDVIQALKVRIKLSIVDTIA